MAYAIGDFRAASQAAALMPSRSPLICDQPPSRSRRKRSQPGSRSIVRPASMSGTQRIVVRVVADGLPKWDVADRRRACRTAVEAAVPLIFANLPEHPHRRLVGKHEDFCFWNHSDSPY